MRFEDITPLRENPISSPIQKATHFDYHFLQNTVINLNVLGHLVPDMLKLL